MKDIKEIVKRRVIFLVTFLVSFFIFMWTAPKVQAHLPKSKSPEVRLHHGITALLWIDKYKDRFTSKRQMLNTQRGHEWLFYSSFDKLGYYDPFMCIYIKERHPRQGWATNTGNGYYGGLQMDWSFLTTYGPKFFERWGTANNWPKWAQLYTGYTAVISGRGFGPWPNTRQGCV